MKGSVSLGESLLIVGVGLVFACGGMLLQFAGNSADITLLQTDMAIVQKRVDTVYVWFGRGPTSVLTARDTITTADVERLREELIDVLLEATARLQALKILEDQLHGAAERSRARAGRITAKKGG